MRPGSRHVPGRTPAAERTVGAGPGGGARAASRALVRVALPAVLLGLTSSCGLMGGPLVGPDYEQAPVEVADEWIDFEDARLKSEEAQLQTWWCVFDDPVLDGLMMQAGAENLSLLAAAERVASARARRDLAVGFQYPQEQGLSGTAGGYRVSEEDANFTQAPFDRTFTQGHIDAFATWELDFWGRFRRAVESADAELQASVADHDDVMVLLYAELATRYISYRTFQDRLRYLRLNESIQLGAYELTQARFDVGEVAERDIHQARQVLEETRSLIPGAELGMRLENNALCTLLGMAPRDLSDILGEAPIPSVPPTVAIGIPADLLRRRPDVRRAERIAASRCALIGIAESDYYPRLSIAGSLGVSAEHWNDADNDGAQTSFLGANLSWSILDWGRTASNVRFFEAEFRAAVLEYQQAVLDAGREAEDSLISLIKTQERLAPQQAAADAAARTVEIVQDQYAEGEVDFSDVFLFSSNLTEQQDRLATTAGDAALALVNVYRSLGGGWTPPPDPEPEDSREPQPDAAAAPPSDPATDGDSTR